MRRSTEVTGPKAYFSVMAQQLRAVPLKAQEKLIKKLVDGALRSWCTGG